MRSPRTRRSLITLLRRAALALALLTAGCGARPPLSPAANPTARGDVDGDGLANDEDTCPEVAGPPPSGCPEVPADGGICEGGEEEADAAGECAVEDPPGPTEDAPPIPRRRTLPPPTPGLGAR